MAIDSTGAWVYRLDLDEVQEADVDINLAVPQCLLCGKPIENQEFFVHLLNTNDLVSTSDGNFKDSQGFFNVGPCCKNRLPEEFVFLEDNENGK